MDRKCIDFSLKYSPRYEFYFEKLQIAKYTKLHDLCRNRPIKTDVEIRMQLAINVLEMLNKDRKMYLETNKNVLLRYDI